MKRACEIHDKANLALLPILGALTVAGLCNWVDPYHVSVFFTVYILIDFLWIWVQRDAVPSLPGVILFHHAVTLLLLCFPLRYPEELAVYTCWDGLCEINTFFLIARRQWKSHRKPLSAIYWATFFPLRVLLYPVMLAAFYRQMQSHAWWELVAVCGSQVLLIVFNVMLLALSIGNWRKRSGSGKRSSLSNAAAGSPGRDGIAAIKTGGFATGKDSSTAVIKAQAMHSPREGRRE